MYFHFSDHSFKEFLIFAQHNLESIPVGFVHEFTGDAKQLKSLLDLDFYIGVSPRTLLTKQSCEAI
jgi:Tat protein secretion system quality control protein TatD with DNase activity